MVEHADNIIKNQQNDQHNKDAPGKCCQFQNGHKSLHNNSFVVNKPKGKVHQVCIIWRTMINLKIIL